MAVIFENYIFSTVGTKPYYVFPESRDGMGKRDFRVGM